MKKLALTIAAVTVLGFAGSALAQERGNPGMGNQGCVIDEEGNTLPNPGLAIVFLGPASDPTNPTPPNFTEDSVGEGIDTNCGDDQNFPN